MTKAESVLFVSSSPSVWGAEGALFELARHGKDNGFLVDFLFAHDSPAVPVAQSLGFHAREYGFAVTNFPSLKMMSAKEVAATGIGILRSAVTLSRLLRRYDVVVAYSLWQALEVALAARIARRPVVLDLHETFDSVRGSRALKWIAKLFSARIGHSRNCLLRAELYTASTDFVVYPPCSYDGAVRFSGDRGGSKIVLGMFGQIAEHKGISDLLDAMDRAQSDEFEVLIVGGVAEPSLRTQFEKSIRKRVESSLGQNIEIIDRVNSVSPLLLRCDLLLNLSQHEAFGRSVAEAVQHNVWPLCLAGGGPEEITSLVGCGDVLSSVEFLRDYLDALDREAIPSPSEHARQRAIDLFEPSKVAREYFEILRAYS